MAIGSIQDEGQPPSLGQATNIPLRLDAAKLIFIAILILAVLSRFVGLGERVMSHDETTHVYFSWLLEQGRGYQHDPLSHGPLQFHLIALSFFLFGDNDATARVPAAVFGVLAIALLWVFRRWLGRTGALVAGALMLVSPYMLYYGRYARNEALVLPLVLSTVWAIFRYIETRQTKWLYLLSLSLSLHFATKETAFISTAQVLVFLAGAFVWDVARRPWEKARLRSRFFAGLSVALIGAGFALEDLLAGRGAAPPEAELAGAASSPLLIVGGLLSMIGMALASWALISAFGERLREDFPKLDLLIVTGTMALPQLAALPATALGWDPLAYDDPFSMRRTVIVLSALIAIGVAVGVAWNWKRWLMIAGIFFVPFIVLHTSVFTNPRGFASGFVGSLGYWLAQHEVQRGSQPIYYYALIQIPTYEFLPAIGSLMAGFYALRGPTRKEPSSKDSEGLASARKLVLLFLAYWALTSLIAYSYAGERMPWLTVHIALPMILLSGWSLSKPIDSFDWRWFTQRWRWLMPLLALVALLALTSAVSLAFGTTPPFTGSGREASSATLAFIGSAAVAAFSIGLLGKKLRGWRLPRLARISGLIAVGGLFLLTGRAAYRAAFLHFDYATEYLVYAHSAPGPKRALEQIEELSRRTTGGLDLQLAYDNETLYPYWWYLRNYTNVHYFGSTPGRNLLEYPVVVAGDGNWSKIDPLLGDRYHTSEYTRIWWPNQDYFALSRSRIESEYRADKGEEAPPMSTWEYLRRAWGHIKPFFSDAKVRYTVLQVWLNRDFAPYFQRVGSDTSLTNWNPSNRMKLYIRKDIGALLWDHGVTPADIPEEEFIDPYAEGMTGATADQSFGGAGSAPGQFQRPRAIALAGDGSLYVADTSNHRVQHLTSEGEVLHVWGRFGSLEEGDAPGGTFNEPWGIAVGFDGTVYVSDTWNHRVQMFTPGGEFVGMFGSFGQAERPDAFWGPRGVMVDMEGRLHVADTGNKRVVVFDGQGNPISQYGGFGITLGGLDEPVALAQDPEGRIYVTDTWNQRVQVFEEIDPGIFQALSQWPIEGWFGQSLDNKPYVAAAGGAICVSDPEGMRALCFNPGGTFLEGWGDQGQFQMPSGLAFDASCGLWVTDAGRNLVQRFQLEVCGP
jgi:uncharacterized protein (TIGR03663 family)